MSKASIAGRLVDLEPAPANVTFCDHCGERVRSPLVTRLGLFCSSVCAVAEQWDEEEPLTLRHAEKIVYKNFTFNLQT